MTDADGDGFPDFPNPDFNGDGKIDAREMAAGVVAVVQWFNGAVQTFAEGKGAPLTVETIAHLFGHSATTLRAEVTAASGTPPIDLQWVPDSALDALDPTVADGLTTHDGVGILTTGEHLSEVMSRLALQVVPNHEVSAASRVLSGLTNQLGLENLWRPGLPANLTDEIGLKGDMCVVTDAGEDTRGSGIPERNPVVVEAEIAVGGEFQDGSGRWHVSSESPMGIVARLVRNDELPELQRVWNANGEALDVTRVTPDHSVAMQVHLVGKNVDGQLVFCGRSQEGVQASPTQSATPSATETARPQGGPGPGPGPEQSQTPVVVVPSATPRPNETPIPPTNTPLGPTEAPPSTATHTSEPPPTAPATSTPEVPPTPPATPTIPPQETPPITPPPTVTPLPVTNTPLVPR